MSSQPEPIDLGGSPVTRTPTDQEKKQMRQSLGVQPDFLHIDSGDSPHTPDRSYWLWVSADITAGNVTVVLPQSPSEGDIVHVSDEMLAVGDGNSLTVDGNGNNIDSDASVSFDSTQSRGVVLGVRYNGSFWKIF